MSGSALPDPVPAQEAQDGLWRDLCRVFKGRQFEYDGDRTLLIPVEACRESAEVDEYLLQLRFLYYPDWPPCATFLNPVTKLYDGTRWPKVDGAPDFALHPRYGDAPSGLVCNSMAFEYYFWGGHTITDKIKWRKGVHTFYATVSVIEENLKSRYYRGPHQ